MKYIKTYKIFESNSNIKFIKLKKLNTESKTDKYNVLKDDIIIGQIKWSSRLRGYAFLPTSDCEVDVKDFIRKLMSDRRKK